MQAYFSKRVTKSGKVYYSAICDNQQYIESPDQPNAIMSKWLNCVSMAMKCDRIDTMKQRRSNYWKQFS